MDLKINTSVAEGVISVALIGAVDISNYNKIGSLIHEYFTEGKFEIVLDLAKVSYIDSSGLGVLISAFKEAKNGGGFLKIINVNSSISGIFQMTRLDTFFGIV